MDDIDAALARLARDPGPPGLSGMEARVMAQLSARPEARRGFPVEAFVIGAALAMGMAGAGFTAQAATAQSSLAPLGGITPLAPSALLAGEP